VTTQLGSAEPGVMVHDDAMAQQTRPLSKNCLP